MSSNLRRIYTEHLTALGLSEVEVDVYVFLLTESPATGYRIAQGTGRTAANAYKAIETLETRGAVMVEEGEPRLVRAVPPDEVLRALDVSFQRHRIGALDALADLTSGSSDDRVYQLKTSTQVYERCRTILQDAKQVVLIDAFREPLTELLPAIRTTVDRGVRVAVLAYERIEIPGAMVVVNHQAEVTRSRWAAQWVNVASDAQQYVNALLTPDQSGVVHAIWSASAFLAHLYHSGLLGELALSAVHSALRAGKTTKQVRTILEEVGRFEHQDTPAFATLREAPLRRAARRTRGA